MKILTGFRNELKRGADPKRAKLSQGYFKTGKGEYGEGDVFLGLTVPKLRAVAKNYPNLKLAEIKLLLKSKIHEERLGAIFILVGQFERAYRAKDESKQKEIYVFYLKNTAGINNWDIVDSSAHKIVGVYLLDKPRSILKKLARSKNIWERRIAIISTFTFIRGRDFKDTLEIATLLLKDEHDLIHKAVGWMLRELGKVDQAAEEDFLIKHYKVMPRTMLRYAIERFSPAKRNFYLGKS